ncbi:MAG TPA: hypothetical protein VI461_11950 [Chitinophagaceae bacterium]|nr:hypothetical protein [Chitinophagaceae bacterium]
MDEINYPDYTIIIQGNRLRDYANLRNDEKSIDKINEYGWVLNNDVIELVVGQNEIVTEQKDYKRDTWSDQYDRKVMFIIGAGASANCVFGERKLDFKIDLLRPPLGPELFDARFEKHYNNYEGVKQSLPILKVPNGNVEELFEREWKNIHMENNQMVLSRHVNIQFYLQELFKTISGYVFRRYASSNLYATLANKLQKIHKSSIKNRYGEKTFKKFAFVSFNQDSILETFISELFGITLRNLNDYVNINDAEVCIFKPHGSWNWGWKFPPDSGITGNTAMWLFKNKINYYQLYYKLLGNYSCMVDWGSWGLEASLSKDHLGKYVIDKSLIQLIDINDINNYYPALLLPYRDKDEFTMPARHFENMRNYLTYVETLIIIGWKGNEEAFNRLLFQNANKIRQVVIADPNPQLILENLQPLLSRPNIEKKFYIGFEDFVLRGIDIELN